MKTIEAFLSYLNRLNIKVWNEKDELCYKAPKGSMTHALRAELVERKPEILTFLKENRIARSNLPPIQPVPRDKELLLSFGQKRLWFLSQFDNGNAAYNERVVLSLKGHLNVTTLKQSLQEIVQRHEILRTTFSTINEKPVQIVHQLSAINYQLSVINLQQLSPEKQDIEVRRLINEVTQHPFDLSKGPLLRTTLLQLGVDSYVLLFNAHHIIFDGWSVGVFFRELSTLYDVFSQDQPSPLSPLPIQYADFAHWQQQWLRDDVLEQQLGYWQQQLANIPSLLKLPTDHLRPPVQTLRGGIESLTLTFELTKQLKTLSQQSGTTLFMTLLTAFAILLYRYSGQSDIIIGSPIANRTNSQIELLIGFFVNTLVLRIDCQYNPSFTDLLRQVRQTTLEAYANQDIPFENLVDKLQPERNLSYSPIFQVMFVLQNATFGNLELSNSSITPIFKESVTAKFDLLLSMEETALGLTGTFEYNTDLFETITITNLIRHFETLLENIVSAPQQQIGLLPLLTESEKQQILVWNNTKVGYPSDKCIHQLFEIQVAKTPDAIVVAFENQQLTYSVLNGCANKLANYLQTLGVKPEVLVGICIERSLEMVIGLLGILKAGGAYVPLDPSYPKERLAFMLEDAQVPVLLTQNKLVEQLPKHQAKIVCLDTDWEVISQYSKENLVSKVQPENLVYVIYTSGSTGKPKGTAVYHQGFTNLVNWFVTYFKLIATDSVLIISPFSFDLTQKNFFAPLIKGGQLHFLSQPYYDPKQVAITVTEQKITWLNCAPSAFYPLLEPIEKDTFHNLASLRYIFLGGEPISLTRLLPWLQSTVCQAKVVNTYGPTEATDICTAYILEQPELFLDKTIPIGKPIFNVDVYVLDKYLELLPIGVAGELHIGGTGLAHGYLNRPEFTKEKFIPNPFSADPKVRLYKTGDLARYLPDGNIEYLGRIDNQVKIRGFRIELGEIESALSKHPAIGEAVVVKTEQDIDNRLIAYIVPSLQKKSSVINQNSSSEKILVNQLKQWEKVFDETYKQSRLDIEPTFNTAGWNDSYTGKPISKEGMQEWVNGTVEQILAWNPKNVLEIGCGMGMLLFQIAPHCTSYVGTDISLESLHHIEQHKKQLGANGAQVKLYQKMADNFDDIKTESYDTIILNSVIQYFPSIDYFLTVLTGAVNLTKPGGLIFIGDVRNLSLLEVFHTDVQLQKVPLSFSIQQLWQNVQENMKLETELVVDPDFFLALKQYFPQINHVNIQLKRGYHHNEMTQFRYDVTLHIGENSELVEIQWQDWRQKELTLSTVRHLLEESQPDIIGFKQVPNARLLAQAKIVERFATFDDTTAVAELREIINDNKNDGIEPEEFRALTHDLPYVTYINWSRDSHHGDYDVIFQRCLPEQVFYGVFPRFWEANTEKRPWHTYANNPLQKQFMSQLVMELPDFLGQTLPDYMVPSAFIPLEKMLLTPSGKIDRHALSQLSENGYQLAKETFVAPRTPEEELLAGIWAEILTVGQVGINDNFFELGGHSLLAVQVVSRICKAFSIELPLQYIFQSPTIAEMAQAIEQIRQTGIVATKTVIDFNAEAVLDSTIQLPSAPVEAIAKPHSIFLTGATSFLGTYLLYELLIQTTANIYCLVRSSNADESKQRLQRKLESYLIWNETFNSRIIPVIGDLSEPLLGLSESHFDHLASWIDVIYHNGAMVNFVYPYSELKATNVFGIQEILKLASKIRVKPVHFISTIGIFPAEHSNSGVVQESDIADIQKLDDGYSQSKWVGERLMMHARDRGLPICIYRPSRAIWHSQTGITHLNDLLNRAIKGCIQLGKTPCWKFEDNMLPVDYVSHAIIHLSQQNESLGKTFHLTNSCLIGWDELFNWFRSLGYQLEQISNTQWRNELGSQKENALFPLLSMFYKESLSEHQQIRWPQFDRQNTIEGLANTDIVCPSIDTKLFDIYFSYLRKSGFLKAPSLYRS